MVPFKITSYLVARSQKDRRVATWKLSSGWKVLAWTIKFKPKLELQWGVNVKSRFPKLVLSLHYSSAQFYSRWECIPLKWAQNGIFSTVRAVDADKALVVSSFSIRLRSVTQRGNKSFLANGRRKRMQLFMKWKIAFNHENASVYK